MVGFDPKSRESSKAYHHVIAGGATGFIVRVIAQPLDVLKIRFQLQVEPIKHDSHRSKYKGLIQSAVLIAKEERILGFWKGHGAAQILTAAYMAVEFASFESFTKLYWLTFNQQSNKANSPIAYFIGGGVAGLTATVASYPFDVIRTRLIAQSHHARHYTGIYSAMTSMYQDGLYNFGRGLGASLWHTVPQASLNFGCYHTYKNIAHRVFNDRRFDAACGTMAGVTSKLLVYPFEVAKRRLQVIGFEEARVGFGATRRYKGILHYIRQALKEEGFQGYYKGLTFALIKSGMTTGLYFFLYETFMKALAKNSDP